MEKRSLANELAGTSAVVLEDQIDLLNYRRDASVCAAGDPAAAVLVSSTDEIGRVVKAAREADQPIYIRGAGSTYAGGANPTRGGVVIDVSPMNRIVELDRGRGLVIVEPGVTYGELLAVLGRDGLTVGIVPLTGASGTIGGAIASHGLGTGSPKYQSTGDEVAGLEVILPDGELLRTGSGASAGAGFFHRYAIGPDLTGLFLGANGTLGVITKLALWVHPLPPHQETLTLGFSDYAAGARFTAHAQLHEMFRNVWYGAGYEDKAVAARVSTARPDHRRRLDAGFLSRPRPTGRSEGSCCRSPAPYRPGQPFRGRRVRALRRNLFQQAQTRFQFLVRLRGLFLALHVRSADDLDADRDLAALFRAGRSHAYTAFRFRLGRRDRALPAWRSWRGDNVLRRTASMARRAGRRICHLRRVAGDRLRTLQERQDVGAPDGSIWQLLPDAAHTQAEPRPKVAVLSR